MHQMQENVSEQGSTREASQRTQKVISQNIEFLDEPYEEKYKDRGSSGDDGGSES